MEFIEEQYSVGALMYSPALNKKVARTVLKGDLGTRYSLALCLEDTIPQSMTEAAEHEVQSTFKKLYEASQTADIFVPKLFVRVREPEQMQRVLHLIRPYQSLLCGFILPKYTVSNAATYNEALLEVNSHTSHAIYMMPILESIDIVDFRTRADVLASIKDYIDSIRELVLNVRVGGNDLSNQFATRRHCNETIYDILPLSQLLGDILTVFSREYVVAGPVWEYFSSDGDEWKVGLQKEVELDKLNGFIGKTVIHPKQISVVNEALRVPRKDYEDAYTILNWTDETLQVGKSYGGERMNEVLTNHNWAKKTILLSKIYGIA